MLLVKKQYPVVPRHHTKVLELSSAKELRHFSKYLGYMLRLIYLHCKNDNLSIPIQISLVEYTDFLL